MLKRVEEKNKRPWGFYEVLAEEPDHKVKRITVYAGERLSLQRHLRRSEHWHLLKGTAVITLDRKEISLRPGESIDIPKGIVHRLRNSGKKDAVLIEIQRGEYFGEDDIERLDDDYGRDLKKPSTK